MRYPSRSLLLLLVGVILFGPSGHRVAAAAPKETVSYVTKHDVSYRNDVIGPGATYAQQRCLLDLYHPDQAKGFATVVWFHGGNLENGERFIPRAMRDQGFAVATVTYRFSPEVKCPAYIEDAAAAVAWVFQHIEEFGGDPTRIFVSGHSAGGYLAAMVGLDPRWLAVHGIEANRIAGLLPFSGQMVTHSTVRKEHGLSTILPIVDEFAPLSHARADAPPLVLITGDRDLDALGRYEENAFLRRVMQAAGHTQTVLYELQGCTHGTMVEPASNLLVEHIHKFVATAAK